MALTTFRHEKPDLMLLDLNLPGIDGLDVCRILHRESRVPIIMLTARAEETDRLIGLELGADDYVVKPFSPREVVARVRAVLRRVAGEVETSTLLRAGDLALDTAARRVTVAGRPVELTPMEFELLAALARAPGRTFARSQLLQQAQAGPLESFERTVDVHVRNLRTKLEPDPKNPRYILTVYGVGYKLAEEPDAT
jgi:DNA-binding response OmpR family regulator